MPLNMHFWAENLGLFTGSACPGLASEKMLVSTAYHIFKIRPSGPLHPCILMITRKHLLGIYYGPALYMDWSMICVYLSAQSGAVSVAVRVIIESFKLCAERALDY